MLRSPSFARTIAIVAWCIMSIPHSVVCGDGVPTAPVACLDAVLGPQGSLGGQVLDSSGVPRVGRSVAAFVGDELAGSARTGDDGRFVITGLQGGVYDIATLESNQAVRCWSGSATAPPQAVTGILLLDNGQAVRGEEGELNPRRVKILTLAALGISITALTLSVVLPIVLSDNADAS